MTELLVGTKKGLFRLEGDTASGFEITARAFAGQSVEYAMRDPRTGRYLASVTSWFYGARIWVTDDPAGEWEQARALNEKLFPLHKALFADASPAPTKYALAKLHDWLTSETRLPIAPCSEEGRKAVDAAMAAAGLR